MKDAINHLKAVIEKGDKGDLRMALKWLQKERRLLLEAVRELRQAGGMTNETATILHKLLTDRWKDDPPNEQNLYRWLIPPPSLN